MAAFSPHSAMPFTGSRAARPADKLVERVRHYLHVHPEVSREEFLLGAVQREIKLREEGEARTGAGQGRRAGGETGRRSRTRPALTAEDIRVHAWLTERLAMLHYERHGLWPRFKRFLFGNRPRL